MGRLTGRVAFITGGARGQGRAHALALAREGADIVTVDIAAQIDTVPYEMSTAEDLQATVDMVEELDRRIVAIQGDVRSQEQLDAAASAAVDTFGHIDILVANAGIWSLGRLWELTDQAWDDMIDVSLTGVWRTMKAVLPHMIEAQRGGSVILTSSVNGLEGAGIYAHYVAAKHGVLGLMRAGALELAPYGIRCNAVCPGFIDTKMTDWQGAYEMTGGHEGATRAEHEAGAYHWHALAGRGLLKPEAVSGAVLWLASDESQEVTGLAIPVDAGHSILPGFSPAPTTVRPVNDSR